MNIQMASADLDQSDIDGVVEVLRSGRLALGPKTEEFERNMASYCGVRHGIAVNSGTSALHLIVRALGIGPGDEVLVPSFTFVASVNAILFEGAVPVFVDILPDTYNLDPADAERKVSSRTRAIMVVDVFGHPADWAAIEELADKHGLAVIDDSCEALGAEYRGRRLGTLGNAAAFAFYPNKQMTTGEGGIIVTDDDEIARETRAMRNQGRAAMSAWLEHDQLGFNYRIDEMSAALGVSQLRRIETFLKRRAAVAAMYSERLAGVAGLRTPVVRDDVRMSWFVYVVTLNEPGRRNAFMKALASRGVPSRAYFQPVHEQPFIRERFGNRVGALPVTVSAASRTVALPFHNRLGEREIEVVVEACRRCVSAG